jgi:hypothetical protein
MRLTDSLVDNDLDPTVLKLHWLKLGPILHIKSFIHYVHFCEEANPINNDWLSITMDDYDQFRFNLVYSHRCCAPLSSLPPLPYVLDVPAVPDVPIVLGIPNAHDISNLPNVPNMPGVPDWPEMPKMTVMLKVSDNHQENIMGPSIDLDELDNELNVTIASDVPNVPNAHDVSNAQMVPNADDVPSVSDISSYVFRVTDVLEVAVTNIPNVTNIHKVFNVI